MMRVVFLVIMTLAVWPGCRPDPHSYVDSGVDDSGSRHDSGFDARSDTGQQDSGSFVDPDCATGAEWVYLVDANKTFIRFEPDSLQLAEVDTLSCPNSGTGSPFSMSVDRNGTAWVLYNGGRIYHVAAVDASCQETSFAPNQSGLELFGMGFVSNAEGSDDETLFIAGGTRLSVGTGPSELATIDPETLTVSAYGQVPGSPELTGTGAGELWGFFPDTTPPSIRQIDKDTGDTTITHDLPELGTFVAEAWAFAFWGGRFYVFLKRDSDDSTHIWQFDPTDESFVDVLPDTGYRIVGAGVSTCAPYILI